MQRQVWQRAKSLVCTVIIALAINLSVQTTARAQAGCTAGACVFAGSQLVNVDTQKSALLNTLFQALLPGTGINATVLDWNAIAGTNIRLNALLAQLQTDLALSDTGQVLSTDIDLNTLRLAMARVAAADGDTVAANFLNTLPLNLSGVTGKIRLGDMFQIDLPEGSLSNIDIDALDLLTGSLQLYNYRNVITTPEPIAVNLPGIANVQLWLQVIEPPVFVCGNTGTEFHTAAVRIKLNLSLLNGLNLQPILNALNGLVGGVANIQLSANVLNVQVYADVARAEGTIGAIDAINQVVTLNARPGLVNLYVGTIADSIFFNRNQVITGAVVSPVALTSVNLQLDVLGLLGLPVARVSVPLQISARAVAMGSPPSLQNYTINGPFPQTFTVSSGTVVLSNLVTDLLNSLDIQVTSGDPVVTLLGALPLPVPLAGLLNPILSTLTGLLGTAANSLIAPVLTTVLGGLVDNLLGLLGISVGNAVFQVEGIARVCATQLVLSKELLPAGDSGRFNLSIAQGASVIASANDVSNGGVTTAITTTPGSVYNLSETAGTGTSLAPYISSWVCTDQVDTTVDSGTGSNFTITAPAATENPSLIICRITNRARQADLSISKSDAVETYTPGTTSRYTIVLNNAGPDAVVAATVQDNLPNGMTLAGPWTCVANNGTCSAANGGAAADQSISLTVDLNTGGQATITVPVVLSANPGDYN